MKVTPALARLLPVPNAAMNGTERQYRARLEGLQLAGEIADYRFQAARLILADRTTYEPDFLVIGKYGSVEFHEVKAGWPVKDENGAVLRYKAGTRDDARVKVKVAARLFPWFLFRVAWLLPKKAGGGWQFEEVAP